MRSKPRKGSCLRELSDEHDRLFQDTLFVACCSQATSSCRIFSSAGNERKISDDPGRRGAVQQQQMKTAHDLAYLAISRVSRGTGTR